MLKKDKFEKEIKDLNEKILILDNQFKRVVADYQNLTKNQQRASIIDKGRLISQFLPVLDDLERITAHFKDSSLEMVIKQFNKILSDQGVEIIDSNTGAQFNPLTMECVEMVEGPLNEIRKTVEKGYRFMEIVLRPAKVEVGSGNQVAPQS